MLRGLHYQINDYSQAKLVRVLHGMVQDVVVDLRKSSSTYGQVYTHVLDAKDYVQMFIPRGCAHGFLTLQDNTVFSYKVDNIYDKDSETGIIYNDPDLKIKWFYGKNDDLIISAKDIELPLFKDCYKFD